MQISEILVHLEHWAPLPYQESYDNAGLITGDAKAFCTGIICTLDVTEAIVTEAIDKGCNLIVAHHPIVFGALKKFTPRSYVEKTLIKAIKNDIAIYAIHTNLDNVSTGVSAAICHKLGLINTRVLAPKAKLIGKLYTYVPIADTQKVKAALFAAGAGTIGLYNECSFTTTGTGTFKPLAGSNPVIGHAGGLQEQVAEHKLEIIFPAYLQGKIIKALYLSHPYEVPAYEIIQLENTNQEVGSGMIGQLPAAITEQDLLQLLKTQFGVSALRHTALLNKPVSTIAVCGGAGSFLTKTAIAAGADVYVTADVKYHEFFDAEDKLVLADIGHWESEQFTIDILAQFLQQKCIGIAINKTAINTNPVHYF